MLIPNERNAYPWLQYFHSVFCTQIFVFVFCLLTVGTRTLWNRCNVEKGETISRVEVTIRRVSSADGHIRLHPGDGSVSTPFRTWSPFTPRRWRCRGSNVAASGPRRDERTRGSRASIDARIPKRKTISPRRWYTSTREPRSHCRVHCKIRRAFMVSSSNGFQM